MACGIYCQGKIAAGMVWSRTKEILDANPLSQEVLVPTASTDETLLIVFAVMLRSPVKLMLAIYREFKLEKWERSPGMRQIDFDHQSSCDLLGSVCNMLTGYPERAKLFYERQLRSSMALECSRVIADHEGQNNLSNG